MTHKQPPPLLRLPAELIEHILVYVSLQDMTNCDAVSSQISSAVRSAQQAWRIQCTNYRFWHPRHNFAQRLRDPQLATPWRELLILRQKLDQQHTVALNSIINSTIGRLPHIDALSSSGFDAKDFLLEQIHVADDLEDCLARKYWAERVLGFIHKRIALETWISLRQDENSVTLERALACIDMFLMPRPPETSDQVDDHIDRIAKGFQDHLRSIIEQETASSHHRESITLRRKALHLASYLERNGFMESIEGQPFYNLQNCLIGVMLCDGRHASNPLVSNTIYCAIARRIGLGAMPNNYLDVVHSVVYPPPGSLVDLDGEPISNVDSQDYSDTSRYLYINPYASVEEVSYTQLYDRLVPIFDHQHRIDLLRPIPNPRPLLLRNANNLTHSNEMNRSSYSRVLTDPDHSSGLIPPSVFDPDGSVHISDIGGRDILIHTANVLHIIFASSTIPLPHVADAMIAAQGSQVLDVHTVQKYLAPLLPPLSEDRERLDRSLQRGLWEDARPPTPKRRADIANISRSVTQPLRYTVGTYVRHRRFGYYGLIRGWDAECQMQEQWIQSMGVDALPQGRQQPFYNVLDSNGTDRYVAEENIMPLGRWQYSDSARATTLEVDKVVPAEGVLKYAGLYMRRWDDEMERFVSNVREEYPGD